MKAFLSYSLSQNNDSVMTLLSSKLREKNFTISTSQNIESQKIDFNSMCEIDSSSLFIGVINKAGKELQRVLDEWNYAIKGNVPNLLLIDDSVIIPDSFKGNFIKFNSKKPYPAIEEINKRMAFTQLDLSNNYEKILPWLLGGAVLLLVIGLLSSKSKN